MSFTKDPDAKLDFAWEWGSEDDRWLADGETISDADVTVPAGLTQSSAVSKTATRVVVWLEGGTRYETYPVTCRITTSQGRVDERTLSIYVDQR